MKMMLGLVSWAAAVGTKTTKQKTSASKMRTFMATAPEVGKCDPEKFIHRAYQFETHHSEPDAPAREGVNSLAGASGSDDSWNGICSIMTKASLGQDFIFPPSRKHDRRPDSRLGFSPV